MKVQMQVQIKETGSNREKNLVYNPKNFFHLVLLLFKTLKQGPTKIYIFFNNPTPTTKP